MKSVWDMEEATYWGTLWFYTGHIVLSAVKWIQLQLPEYVALMQKWNKHTILVGNVSVSSHFDDRGGGKGIVLKCIFGKIDCENVKWNDSGLSPVSGHGMSSVETSDSTNVLWNLLQLQNTSCLIWGSKHKLLSNIHKAFMSRWPKLHYWIGFWQMIYKNGTRQNQSNFHEISLKINLSRIKLCYGIHNIFTSGEV